VSSSSSLRIRERCVKNALDLIILKTLEEEPKGGYEIIAHIHNTFQVLFSPGTIYPLLEAMEQRGMVKRAVPSGKRFYTSTEKGRELSKRITFECMAVYRILTSETIGTRRNVE